MKDSKYYKKLRLRKKQDKEPNYGWMTRLLLSVIFVLVSLILTNLNKDFKAKYYEEVLNKNMNFNQINEFYRKYIGKGKENDNDVEIANLDDKALKEVVKENNSFKLNVGNDYPVAVLKPGIIVFMGDKDDLGNTIIIQGNDGIDIWYSNITVSDYSLYDYVSTGDILGVNNEDYYKLTIMKDGKYLEYDEYFS